VNQATAGMTIYVRGGTYNEAVKMSKSGTAGSPVTLTSYQGESVTLNGGSNTAISAVGALQYVVIDGLTIRSTNRYTMQLGWWGNPATAYITVKNNKIYGANFLIGSYHLWENNNIDGTGYTGAYGDAGITDADTSHHNTYRGNTVHDFTHVDARGIWTQGFTHDTLIENNTVYNINAASGIGQCIDLDGAYNVEWRHTVRGNKLTNCNYVGIQLENVFDSVIENNVIVNARPAGIIVISYGSDIGCKVGGENNQYGDTNGDNSCRGDQTNNILRQNVISTTSYWGWGYGGIMNWYAGGVKIWGNTIYAPDGAGNGGVNIQGTRAETYGTSLKGNVITQTTMAAVCATDLKSIVEDNNNLYYRTGTGKPYGQGASCDQSYSVAEYQSLTGLGAGNVMADPQFKNAAGGDLHVNSGSPAIDTGVSLGTSKDADGNPRPQGATYDKGAYESSSAAQVPQQPTTAPTTIVTVTPTAIITTMPTATSTAMPTATMVPTSMPTALPTATAVPTLTPTPITSVKIPGVPELVSPIGDITTYLPTYKWKTVSDATYYILNVNGAKGVTIKQTYLASKICDSTYCSVTPFIAMKKGMSKWRVQAGNSAGLGTISDWMTFTIK